MLKAVVSLDTAVSAQPVPKAVHRSDFREKHKLSAFCSVGSILGPLAPQQSGVLTTTPEVPNLGVGTPWGCNTQIQEVLQTFEIWWPTAFVADLNFDQLRWGCQRSTRIDGRVLGQNKVGKLCTAPLRPDDYNRHCQFCILCWSRRLSGLRNSGRLRLDGDSATRHERRGQETPCRPRARTCRQHVAGGADVVHGVAG